MKTTVKTVDKMIDKTADKTNNKTIFFRILSFALAAGLMTLIFLFNKMNGKDFLVIRSDFLDGIGIYREFVRNIITHNSLFFSYSTGLGLNNAMTMSGMFSPFALFYLIFNKADLNFITTLIIIIKVGLAALSFQVFSDRIIKNHHFLSVIISVFYSLNAYTIEYGTIQNGWIEALIILPVLCGSIVGCLEENKRVNATILYAYLFISNYYMGYMVGVFTLLFVIFYLIFVYEKKTEKPFKELLGKFFNWALTALTAIMLSAFVWVPTLFFLASNRVPDSSEIRELSVSVFQIINSLFWGSSYGIEGTYSYIYCGLPVFMLVLMFFLNKGIDKKWKKFYGTLAVILVLSMVSNRLNTFWHVFDQPDDFWYRYSFLFCFCLCVMAAIEIKCFGEEENGKLIRVILGLSIFYQLILHTISLWKLDVGVLNTNYGFIVNLVFMALWGLVLFFTHSPQYDNKKIRILCGIMALIIMSFELVSNSKRQMVNLISAKPYNVWNESVEKTVNEIKSKDPGYYRMITAENNDGYNSDIYFGYYGIGDFGNQEKYAVRKFLSNVGFATSPRITCENGFNPVADMLLGIKYELYTPEINFKPNVVTYTGDKEEDDQWAENNTKTTYRVNEYALNFGYLVDGDILLYKYSGRDVFKNMNEITSALSGIEGDCYIPFSKDDMILESDYLSLSEMDTGDMVFERSGDSGELKITVPKGDFEEAYIQFEKDEPGVYGIDYYVIGAQNAPSVLGNRLAVSSAIKMDTDEETGDFTITVGSFKEYSPELFICDDINIYYLDEDALQKQYDELSKNQYEITGFSNGHIEGTIHVDGDKRMLFTTIPYDPGWKAYINGIETEPIRVIDGTFMAILLPAEGDYNVTLDFECPGLKIGIIVSVCGILALLSIIFEKKLKKNK